MTLPKALQDAEARANAMIEGNSGKTEQAKAEADPSKEAMNGQPQEGTPGQQKATQDPDNGADWKHKYEVLQGMFNRQKDEAKDLRDKVKSLSERTDNSAEMQQLQQRLQQLEQQNRELMQQQKQNEPIKLNENLVNDYGEDFARAVAEQSRASISAEVDSLRNEYAQKMQQLEGQFKSTQDSVSQVSSDTRWQSLSNMLRQSNIDLDATNSDPDFHKWLSQPESELSGIPRQQLLEQAYNNGDLQRTARIFAAFVESQKQAPNNPLNNYVDPLTSSSPTENPNNQGQPFDPNALVRLNREMQEGRLTQAEFDRREAELYARLTR